MGLYDKIEEIRRQPENIRMRYVWTCVGVTMLFVLVIWFISLKSGIAENKQSILPINFNDGEITNQSKEQKDSLKNVTQGLTNAISQQNTDVNNGQ